MQVLRRTGAGSVAFTIRFTDASDGDFAVASVGVGDRRSAVDERPWTWLNQVHGSDVVTVLEPGEFAGATADASVSDTDGAVLAAQGADCAPVVFWSNEGPFGIAHAGWKGVEAGVLGEIVARLRGLGSRSISAAIGPCIHPDRYEFGEQDLHRLERRFGSVVRSRTLDGGLALDLPALIVETLTNDGVHVDHVSDVCTGLSPVHFSHRVSGDTSRQCGLIVRESMPR